MRFGNSFEDSGGVDRNDTLLMYGHAARINAGRDLSRSDLHQRDAATSGIGNVYFALF